MMFKHARFFLALIIALTLVAPVLAQEPVFKNASDPNWLAWYWNNTSLSGTAVLQRTETDLSHDWGAGSPHASVPADRFSARWTRYLYLDAGTYRFAATSDDGVRVWIDNELVIDRWSDHPVQTFSVEKSMTTGHHWVVVEYYENQGLAVAKFLWERAGTPVQGWHGEYFGNMALSGNPVLVRDDANIDFDWGGGSPAAQVPVDRFSARWTRTVSLAAGNYRFSMTVDDGARLWINNNLVFDVWKDQPATTYTAEVSIPATPVPIKMEYYENGGTAVAKLAWTPVSATIQNWRGEYYNNTTLSGNPALVRDDANINFDWGTGSPVAGTINADNFSARWTRTLDLPAGHYRFDMTVDDGGRLWLGNQLLIDAWKDQPARTYSVEIDHSGGTLPVTMAYYERGGLAVAKLTWTQTSPSVSNWRGEYFNNKTLSGTPAVVRDDTQINFNWGAGSPAAGSINVDQFSARWTRTINLNAGRYRFSATVDDGARLWVNGTLLIDAWYDQATRTHTGSIDLPGGAVSIKMEYYENGGLAVAQLTWAADGAATGTVIVDDTDAGFVKGGSPTGWRLVNEGYGGHLTWTWNNNYQRANYNWARWYPHLPAGQYEVYVFIPARYSTTSSAHYWVAHRDGFTSRVVNQSTSGDQWVSLGTYRFDGGDDEYVSLNDITGEPYRTQLIAFDAVQWVWRGA